MSRTKNLSFVQPLLESCFNINMASTTSGWEWKKLKRFFFCFSGLSEKKIRTRLVLLHEKTYNLCRKQLSTFTIDVENILFISDAIFDIFASIFFCLSIQKKKQGKKSHDLNPSIAHFRGWGGWGRGALTNGLQISAGETQKLLKEKEGPTTRLWGPIPHPIPIFFSLSLPKWPLHLNLDMRKAGGGHHYHQSSKNFFGEAAHRG